jgi:DNA-binding NarL/FixJ family response regulator
VLSVYLSEDNSQLQHTFLRAVSVYEQAVATHRQAVGAYSLVASRFRVKRFERTVVEEDEGLLAPTVDNKCPLTPRQREVAALIARGYTNQQIASALVVTPGTAANHVAQIMERLGVANRALIAVWAVENGIGSR